jgi:hypothetical protein
MVPQYLRPSFSERMQAARDAHKAAGTSGGRSYRTRDAADYAPADPDSWQVFLWRVISRARDDRDALIETAQHELALRLAGTFADQGDGAFLHVVEHGKPRRISYEIPF